MAPSHAARRAGHLVREVDVARRVDEVQRVRLAVARLVEQAHGVGLDRDPALALEVHRVEHLVDGLRGSIVPVSSRSRSASVDFPWSMCAMIEKLRMRSRLIASQSSTPRRSPGRSEGAAPALPAPAVRTWRASAQRRRRTSRSDAGAATGMAPTARRAPITQSRRHRAADRHALPAGRRPRRRILGDAAAVAHHRLGPHRAPRAPPRPRRRHVRAPLTCASGARRAVGADPRAVAAARPAAAAASAPARPAGRSGPRGSGRVPMSRQYAARPIRRRRRRRR